MQNKNTILVVDDQSINIDFIVTNFKDKYSIKVASNGEMAFKVLDKFEIDLVLLDIQMPIMDGFELAKTIQQQTDIYKKQPIIAVTGQSDLDNTKYKDAGFSTVISKPFSPQILLKTIDAIFNKEEIPLQETVVSKKSSSQLYSLDSIQAFLNHDEVDVKNILTSFVASAKSNLLLLESDVNENDFANIKAISHKMVPMFKQIEAYEIASFLTNLEINDYTETEVKSIYEKLHPQIKTVISDIEKYVN